MTFEASITDKDLYKFNLKHAYTSSQGVISFFITILLIITVWNRWDQLTATMKVLYLAVAIVFSIYIPLTLKGKSKKQFAASTALSNPLSYEFTEEDIVISSQAAGEKANLPWNYIYQIVTTKDYLLIYTNRVNAYIIPKEQIIDKYPQIKEYLAAHVDKHKLTLKW